MQPPPASAAAGAAAPSAAAASAAAASAGAAAPSAAAGAAAAGGKGCGKRRRYVFIETRQCHACEQYGHLQQSCPSCQAVELWTDMQRQSSCSKLDTDMQEAKLMQRSADPLPIRHEGGIRWQGVSYGGGCEGMAAAAATATVTALTATATTATATAVTAIATTATAQQDPEHLEWFTCDGQLAHEFGKVRAQQEPAVEGAVEERVLGDLTSDTGAMVWLGPPCSTWSSAKRRSYTI